MLLRSHGAKRPWIFDEKTPDEKTHEKTLVNGASQLLAIGICAWEPSGSRSCGRDSSSEANVGQPNCKLSMQAFAWFSDLLVEHSEIFWSLFGVDMDTVLKEQPPDT